MYRHKKFFEMTKPNSMENKMIRPDALMAELGIKKSKYYQVLKELGIKADKDSNKKLYLEEEQAEQIRAYLLDDTLSAENEDSDNSSLVKVDDSNEIVSNNNQSSEDIYIKPEEPTVQFDFNQLMRGAQEIKLRELATPDLLMRGIADQLTEEDLSDDLKEKLAAVREAVNPKWTPASLATEIVAQYRSNRSGS